MKRLIPLVVVPGLFAGCQNGGGSPTTPAPPTTTPAATRTIALEGDLNFGDVVVGHYAEKVIRILNRGTATMTVSSLSEPPAVPSAQAGRRALFRQGSGRT